jgi:acid stress-induced BolA-like protein IbaG/YrbA
VRNYVARKAERNPDAAIEVDGPAVRLEGKGRVSGSLVSATFTGKREHQRQQMIWDALDEELGAASVKEVGVLLAHAPDEWDLPLEGTVARATVRQAKPKSHKQPS